MALKRVPPTTLAARFVGSALRFSQLRNKPVSSISSPLILHCNTHRWGTEMSKITEFRRKNVARSMSSQRELIEEIRFELTERQAASGNHREQDALQAELDRYTAIAADLDRVLEKLVA